MGFRLSLTGRPDLTDTGGRSLRLPRKAFALAAYLLLDPPKGALPRDRAARFLWEDADPSRRAGNLRQFLARMKEFQTESGCRLFVIDTDHVALDADAAEIDVARVLGARADDKELDLALDYARQAIAASPEGAHGLHQLGICSIYKKNHELGLDALRRSERYVPFEEELIADYADALIVSGFAAEGLEKIRPLLEDRIVPSDQMLWIAASGQYLAGRYQEALATLSRLASQEPAYQLKAACHAMLAQEDEARRYARKLREILPDFKVSMRLGMVPLRRREDIEHYENGLRSAGFD